MATYYVKNGGNDGADGLSDANAWATISKVNSSMSTFAAGDSILFKRGSLWREQLTMATAGSAGNPITFGAYDTGTRPEIRGSETVTSGWTEESTNIWYASFSGTPAHVTFIDSNDDIFYGFEETVKANLTANYEWFWDSGNSRIYVYSVGSPPWTVEGAVRSKCVELQNSGSNSNSYITIENLILRCCQNACVHVRPGSQNISNIIVQDCLLGGAGSNNWEVSGTGQGFMCFATTGEFDADSITIRRCEIRANENHGIKFLCRMGNAFSNIVVEQNDVSYSGHSCIDLALQDTDSTITTSTVRYNRVRGPAGHTTSTFHPNGIVFISQSVGGLNSGVNCSYNLCYDLGGAGIFFLVDGDPLGAGITGTIAGNTAYSCVRSGSDNWRFQLDFSNNTNAITVKNNISMDTWQNACIRFESLTGKTIDNNDWFRSGGGAIVNVGGTDYPTLAAWKAAANPEAQNDISSDPLFVNAGARNFTLQSGSPCRNAGANLGVTYDDGLDPDSTWPNAVTLLDQDNYGSGWEMGAYVYEAESPSLTPPVGSTSLAGVAGRMDLGVATKTTIRGA